MTHHVSFSCDACGVMIPGTAGDPQEAPRLYCPECGEQMQYDVDWRTHD